MRRIFTCFAAVLLVSLLSPALRAEEKTPGSHDLGQKTVLDQANAYQALQARVEAVAARLEREIREASLSSEVALKLKAEVDSLRALARPRVAIMSSRSQSAAAQSHKKTDCVYVTLIPLTAAEFRHFDVLYPGQRVSPKTALLQCVSNRVKGSPVPVVLGKELAAKLGVSDGGTISLLLPQPVPVDLTDPKNIPEHKISCRVVGTFVTGLYDLDRRNLLIADRDLPQAK